MPRIIAFFGLLLAGLGLSVAKAPHLRLAMQFASGEIDGRPVPVSEFVPARFEEKTVSLRYGDLVLEVPTRVGIGSRSEDDSSAFSLVVDGLRCRGFPPRHAAKTEQDYLGICGLTRTDGRDSLRQLAAACAASGRDLSFRMSAAEVELLKNRLEMRVPFCLFAERVEVVRGKTLLGLLTFATCQGRPCMAFEYFSPDLRTKGSVILFADTSSDQAIRATRALVSTFRLDPA